MAIPDKVGGELKLKKDPEPEEDADGDETDWPFPIEIDFCRIFRDEVDGMEEDGEDGLPRLAFSARSRSMVSLFAFSRTGKFLNVKEPKSNSLGGSLDLRSRRRVCSLTCGGMDNGSIPPRFRIALSVLTRRRLIGSLSIASGVCKLLGSSADVSSSGNPGNVVKPRESK